MAITVSLLLFGSWSGSLSAREDGHPDVLMIAVDDLRPMLSCYGDPRIQTPNIDRLAKRSVVFDRAYCQYAKCGPSRLSLMTGLRPDAVGVFDHRKGTIEAFRKRRPDAVTLARHFKDGGYVTRGFGKIMHDGWDSDSDWSEKPDPGREQEILEIASDNGPSIIADRHDCPVIQSPDVEDDYFFAGRMTTSVLQTLRDHDDSKPLFLVMGYRRPHLPFVAPKKYFDQVKPDRSWLPAHPLPPENSPIMAWFNSDGYGGAMKRVGVKMPSEQDRQGALEVNGYELRSYVGATNQGMMSEEEQLRLLHAYVACVLYVDAQIGLLLDDLEKRDRLDDTVILFWADHGWHLGDKAAWSKMTNFETATRVPMMISAPGIRPGRTQAISELVDLYPTLCDLVNLPMPTHLQGHSLVSILKKPETKGGIALSQHQRFKKYMGRALRNDRYRYVAWFREKDGVIVERELYDHQLDPDENVNLAAEAGHQKTVRRLEARLLEAFELNNGGAR